MPHSSEMEVGEIVVCEGACGCVLVLRSASASVCYRMAVRMCIVAQDLISSAEASPCPPDHEQLINSVHAHFDDVELRRPLDVEHPRVCMARAKRAHGLLRRTGGRR